MKALAAILLIVFSATVHAQSVTGAEIVDYGVIKKIISQGLLDAPNTLTGKTNNAIVDELVQSTTTIKASIGTTFGIFVKLLGELEGAVVTSHFRCVHPKLIDPVSGHTGETDEWDGPLRIGVARYLSYTFDNEWELVPGKWTIQVLDSGKVLAEKTFEVIAASTSNQPMKPTAP
jgi:Domain of unknown function (DUF3859)